MRSLGRPGRHPTFPLSRGSQKGFLIPFSLVPAAVDGEPGGRPRGVGKQVFVAHHHPVDTSTPFHPLFLHEKPERIEHLCEYPHLEVFRTMLVGYLRM